MRFSSIGKTLKVKSHRNRPHTQHHRFRFLACSSVLQLAAAAEPPVLIDCTALLVSAAAARFIHQRMLQPARAARAARAACRDGPAARATVIYRATLVHA